MESYLELQRRKILSGKPSQYTHQSIVAVREPLRIKDVTSDPERVSELESQVQKLADRLAAIEQRTDAQAREDGPSRPSHRRRVSSVSLSSRCSTIEPTIIELQETPVQTPKTKHFPLHFSDHTEDSRERDLTPKRLWAMWQHYRSNVDPLLKLVHVPAVQHLFLSTEEELKSITAEAESLKWAICFAAAASLQPAQDDASSCHTSETMLSTYAIKLEQSLAKSRFLADPTIATVQALTLYLVCGQRFLEQSYIWSLMAILVRISIKLKLNRDPETQGLSFLDSEFRRRLWWHICTLDARVAEVNGTDPLIYERQCTARFPLSIQDADFESIQDVEARRNSQVHASDTFCNLLRFEITYYMRTVLFSDDFMEENAWPILPPDGKLSVIDYLEKILEEKYYRSCNCESSICKLAIASSRITVARLKLAALIGEQGVDQLGKDETDQVLSASAILLENLRSIREDPGLSRWTWLCQPHAEWNAAAMCLSVLVLGRWKSKAVTRAWNAITLFFIGWKESSYDPQLYKRWVKLEGLKARVEKLQRNSGGEDRTSSQSSGGYTAYSPNASLSANSKPAYQRALSSPSGESGSQVGSISSKSSGSVRSAFSDQDWPFPKEVLQETVDFDLKAFALMI